MKLSSQSRKVKPSESLNHRLNMYALAAGAAGVSALALAPGTEAKVVYTSTSVTLWPEGAYRLDLNHDGKSDFTLANRACVPVSSGSCVSSVAEMAKLGNSVAGSPGRPPFALAFQMGSMIGGPHEHFYPGEAMLAGIWNPGTYCSGGAFGPWAEATNCYLGFKFQIKRQVHYGWARLNVNFSVNQFKVVLTGYAYETIPNKPIIAGKTKGTDAITLQPATLGHLAAGSAAIPAWRTTGGN